MSHRPTSLIFTQTADFIPPGVPLETWEVIADINCSFEIEPSGRLIRKNWMDSTRWTTKDFTGSFTIANVPKHSLEAHIYMVYLVCGAVKHMVRHDRATEPLNALKWVWVLDDLVVDRDAVELSKTYRGCLELIQSAEIDPGFKTGDDKTDGMIGMALCRPALLKSNPARNALEWLEDHQLRAVTSWYRARLPT